MRYYGRYNVPEQTTYCVVEVDNATTWLWHQCYRKRGYGPNGEYCKQHTKMIGCGKYVYVPEDR